MSLQYIIDGYNIIKHPLFTHRTTKKKEPRSALLEFIRVNRLCGSLKNKITVVFDGYPNLSSWKNRVETDINILFSRDQTADESIIRMVEASGNPKNVIVVSDDKEIKFFTKAIGAKVVSVEEFIGSKEKLKQKKEQEDTLKLELTYSQMHKINQELRKIWQISS